RLPNVLANLAGELEQRARLRWIGSGPCRGLFGAWNPGVAVHREHPVEPPQLEGAVVAHTVQADVRHGIHGYHRHEPRRVRDGERVLCPAFVRHAECTDLAIRPRLSDDPTGGVDAVIAVVHKKPPVAFRSETPADVLNYHG